MKKKNKDDINELKKDDEKKSLIKFGRIRKFFSKIKNTVKKEKEELKKI